MTDVERYLLFGERKIAGWLDPYTAEFIAAISTVQSRAGLRGAVGEIGVHHGKLFVLLCLLLAADEAAFAIDVFDAQDLNTDGSGRGDRDILEDNIRYWARESMPRITFITKSSLVVGPQEIAQRCGPVRLASIDGGHTAECVYNDLKLIESTTAEYGVAVLDDYFNADWPDVSTGTADYMMEKGTKMRPFAVAPNKVFLCRSEYSEFYRQGIRERTPFRRYKESRMFGHAVDVFHGLPTAPPVGIYLREFTRNSMFGPHLIRLKRRLARAGQGGVRG